MPQVSVRVLPLKSVYTFEAAGVQLIVTFQSAQLLDDPDLLSATASFVHYEVRSLDGNAHDVQLYLDVSYEWCVPQEGMAVTHGQEKQDNMTALWFENAQPAMLERSGDDLRIEWGKVYLAAQSGAFAHGPWQLRNQFAFEGNLTAPQGDIQVQAVMFDFGVSAELREALALVGYDDEYSLVYFGDMLRAWWQRNGMSGLDMMVDMLNHYSDIKQKADAVDAEILGTAMVSGGEKYADILALAYRQACAAHKCVADTQGNLLFMSKECYSNGCINTVDVSYPSMPLFLLYNPELVRGMMRGILRYAASDAWPYAYAPHDIGQYPLANGQVYGMKSGNERNQMPVEECGNMLLMAAIACLRDDDFTVLETHWEMLDQWAQYLADYGGDPGDQLCTDDFAGHLAHNANLAVKAIVALGAYAKLRKGAGKDPGVWAETAQKMAQVWMQAAADDGHTRLTLDGAGTWSLKYNMVWDDIFELGLFPMALKKAEVEWYRRIDRKSVV